MSEQESSAERFTPAGMLQTACEIGTAKAHMSFRKLLVLSVLAGIYIGMGGLFSSIAATGASGIWPYGMTKLVQGLVFSTGLILVVVGGAELFTGNSLMIIALAQKKISLMSLLRNWGLVYVGNFIGSFLLALAVVASKVYHAGDGLLGSQMLTIANAKSVYGFGQAVMLGLLCNVLVCLAVWLTYGARSLTDKVLAIVFPISLFVAAGFEHSVANMYLIPAGILLKIFDPAFTASLGIDLSNLTWQSLLVGNLLPVTLGNILGGSFLVGLMYHFAYQKAH